MKRLFSATVLLSAFVIVPLATSDWKPDAAQLIVLILTSVLLTFVAFPLLRTSRSVEWPTLNGPYVAETVDERVTSLLSTMYASDLSNAFALRETLLTVLDERLLTHHGLTLVDDPHAARALLGPRLRRLIDRPARSLARLPELRAVLTELEKV